jgi:hypothetical protein
MTCASRDGCAIVAPGKFPLLVACSGLPAPRNDGFAAGGVHSRPLLSSAG